MNLPAGLEAVRHNRPLFADYILGLIAAGWGIHGFVWPLNPHAIPSYRWLTVGSYVMPTVALSIGIAQIVAALALHIPSRRLGAMLGAALFMNFAVNIFKSIPQAPGSAVDFMVGVGNLVLFFWPYL